MRLPIEILLGTILVLLVVEAARRALSRWMAITIGIAIFYLATSPYWPGLLRFKGYSYPRMVEVLFLAGDEGIFGFLSGISSNILYIYIIFASFTPRRSGPFSYQLCGMGGRLGKGWAS